MIIYLFEVSFSWLIFYLAYLFFLQQERFFGVNRAYLLVALIGGLGLPFLQIETTNTYLTPLPILLNEITIGTGQNIDRSTQSHLWNFSEIFLIIYLIGVFIGLLRFALFLKNYINYTKTGLQKTKYSTT